MTPQRSARPSNTNVEWNSCSRSYRGCSYLNFPGLAGTAPYPANGYPFTDSYGHNNYVPLAGGSDTCVDQWSPCGPNVYGTVYYNIGVSAVQDLDGDNILDSGGCKDLDGYQIGVQNNFMSVYELDWDGDDIINSLYFPTVWATLSCTADYCRAANDSNYDGWIDDIYNRFHDRRPRGRDGAPYDQAGRLCRRTPERLPAAGRDEDAGDLPRQARNSPWDRPQLRGPSSGGSPGEGALSR